MAFLSRFRMRLIADWRAVLRHGWTPRLIVLGGLLNGAYAITSVLVGTLPVPPMWLAGVNGLLAAVTFVARFIPQKPISGDPDADQ